MLNYIKKISNINNLSAGKPLCGQIATLLILMMVVVLIFILITVHIGQFSLSSTTFSNTADTCALSLASQLSTKASSYHDAMKESDAKYKRGPPPHLEGRGGILPVFLSVVCAIVGAILAAPTGGVSVYAGAMISGAIGGATGGIIIGSGNAGPVWESALCGAIQGALIGAAIGGAVTNVIQPGGIKPAAGKAIVPTTAELGKLGAVPTIAESAGPMSNLVLGAGPEAGALGGGTLPATTAPTVGLGAIDSVTLGGVRTFSAGQTVPAGMHILSGQVACAIPPLKAGFDIFSLSAGNLYQAGMQVKIERQILSDLVKQLKTLPTEEDTIRDGIIFQGMMAVVDDPNKTTVDLCVDCDDDGTLEGPGGDPCDSDNDGDIAESVPYFQYWRHRRTLKFKKIAEELRRLTGEFIIGHDISVHRLAQTITITIPGPLAKFADFCESQYAQSSGPLCRIGIEPEDGIVVSVAKALAGEGRDFHPFFYKPWVPPNDTSGDEEDTGETVNWDEIELVKSDLKDFVETARSLQKMPIEQLSSTWRSWINWFEKNKGDKNKDTLYSGYYEMFETLINGRDTNKDVPGNEVKGLSLWIKELEDKRSRLPACIYKGDKITNPPCQDGCAVGVLDCFATIDEDKGDEFKQAITAIDGLISAMETFKAECEKYQDAMENAYIDIGKIADNDKNFDFGGINPATYKWTDSLGENRVIVEVSPFKIPRVETESSRCVNFLGRDICENKYLYLRDYCDNCAGCDDTTRDTYVRITRKYPVSEIKSGTQVLGKAGIYDNYDPLDDDVLIGGVGEEKAKKDGFFSVSKKSRVYYKDYKVGLLKD